MGSGSLLALLIIVIVSLLIVRIGTNALLLTGMSLQASRFQAASAFFGVGFTTSEAEMVVRHAVRRKIVLQPGQGPLHVPGMQLTPDRFQDRQVDQFAMSALDDEGRCWMCVILAHEGPAAGLSADQTPSGRLLVGTTHGLNADAQLVSQRAMSRQAFARCETAALNSPGDFIRQ